MVEDKAIVKFNNRLFLLLTEKEEKNNTVVDLIRQFYLLLSFAMKGLFTNHVMRQTDFPKKIRVEEKKLQLQNVCARQCEKITKDTVFNKGTNQVKFFFASFPFNNLNVAQIKVFSSSSKLCY